MVKRVLFFVSMLTTLLAIMQPAWAKDLTAEPDRTRLYEGEVLMLTVRGSMEIDLNLSNLFNFDLSQLPAPDIEKVEPDFEILARNQRYSVQTVNGDMVGEITWTYQLAPTRTGTLTIPQLRFQDSVSEPVTIDVVSGTPPDQATSSRDSFIELSADKAEVYVQEQLLLTIQLFFSGNLLRGELSEPEHPDAIIEPLGKQREFTRYRDGVQYRVVERRYAIFPQQPGQLTLAPVRFEGQARDANGQLRVLRDRQQLYDVPVKPIPDSYPGNQPWLPATSLTLAEEGLPSVPELAAGSNLSRKITLQAEGLPAEALPPLPQQAPDAIRSYPEQPLRNTEATQDGLRATLQQVAALVPVQAGEVVLPAIRIPWWNTQTNELAEAVLPERRYQIDGDNAVIAAPVTDDTGNGSPVAEPEAIDQPAASTGPSIWFWSTLVLAGLWAATLAFWWLSRRQHGGVTATPNAPASDTEKHAFDQLIQAVRKGSPHTTGLLLHWAKIRFPDQNFVTAADVVRFSGDNKLDEALRQLQENLFSSHGHRGDDTQDKRLQVAIDRLRTQKGNAADSPDGLPALY